MNTIALCEVMEELIVVAEGAIADVNSDLDLNLTEQEIDSHETSSDKVFEIRQRLLCILKGLPQ